MLHFPIRLLFALMAFFVCGPLCALPIGNPAEPSLFTCGVFTNSNASMDFLGCDILNVRIGYYGDFVFDRNLRIQGDGLGHGKVIRKTEIRTNAGYIALNFLNRLDVFGTAGASRLWIEQNETSWFQTGGNDGQLQTDTHFSWSVGARVALLEWGCFTIGIEGQYFEACFDITHYISGSQNRVEEFNDNNSTKYYEWQGGIGLAYNVYVCNPQLSMVPYIGFKGAQAKYDTRDFTFTKGNANETLTIFNLESNKDWGFAVGLTFTLCNKIGVTAEGRFADEQAFYVNGEFRF